MLPCGTPQLTIPGSDHTGYQSYQLLFESLYYSIYHVVNNEFYDSI